MGITGGSNGGLLTLATSLQRPELFGAVIADVAVADMAREAHWESDYGDRRRDKNAFATAMRYSPVHNIREGVKYPPTLVMTGEGDDRVKPGLHSYKFVATMQEKSPETLCLLHVEPGVGHSGARESAGQEAEKQRMLTFFEKALGPISQHKYKASMAEVAEQKPARKWTDIVSAVAKAHPRIQRTGADSGVGM